MVSSAAYVLWHHRQEEEGFSTIFPDGCRDVLIWNAPAGPPVVTLSAYDHRPRKVGVATGTEIIGFRLRPGEIPCRDLLDAVADAPDKAAQTLDTALGPPGELTEAIEALSLPGSTALAVAATLGVSSRTMQRRFRACGLPPPEFWRLLGRARRCARRLGEPAPLADVAGDSGYSDQAHMTRELLRWFGLTPRALRRMPQERALICQPALGTWTAEQISTR